MSQQKDARSTERLQQVVEHQVVEHRVGIIVSIITVIALGLAGLVFIANEKLTPMTHDELQNAADQWRATAVSGQMLIEQWNAQRINDAYFADECQFLHDNATQEQDSLSDAQPEEALKSEYQHLAGLADQISGNVEQLCSAFQDNPRRQKIYLQLKSLADQL